MSLVERFILIFAFCLFIVISISLWRFVKSGKPIPKEVKIGIIGTVLIALFYIFNEAVNMRIFGIRRPDEGFVAWLITSAALWVVILGYKWIKPAGGLDRPPQTYIDAIKAALAMNPDYNPRQCAEQITGRTITDQEWLLIKNDFEHFWKEAKQG